MPKANLVVDQGSRYQWSSSTAAAQALQSPDASTRRAACFYDVSQLRMHLTFPAAYSGTLHLYSVYRAAAGIRDSSVTGVQTCALTIYLNTDFSQGAWV